jgi:hypothetical protein
MVAWPAAVAPLFWYCGIVVPAVCVCVQYYVCVCTR